MNVDPNIRFTRVRNGYNPQEVDSVFDEMQREIGELKSDKQSLNQTIRQYNEKTKQLADSTKQLEEERCKESLRLTGMMNVAARMAEQAEGDARKNAAVILEQARRDAAVIIHKARREAEKMISDANCTRIAARESLSHLENDMQSFRQSVDHCATDVNAHLSELDLLLDKLIKDIPLEPLPDIHQSAPAASAAAPVPVLTIEKKEKPTVSESVTPEFDPYTEFIKNMEKEVKPAPVPETRKKDGFLGHFGD